MPESKKVKKTRHWEKDILKLEAAYKDSEKKYWELIDLIPLGIFEYNLEGMITQCNPYGLEMLGYSKEDLEGGFSVFSLVHPDQYDIVKNRFSRLFRGEALEGEEYQAIMKNGNTFPVLLYSYPIYAGEDVIGVRGVAFDLTKSKKIEKQMQDVLTRYELMLQSLPDIIFRFDKDGRFIDFHANSPEKLAMKPDDFMGKLITDVQLPGDISKNSLVKIKEAIKLGDIIKDEYMMEEPEGKYYFEARYIPIGEKEVQVIIRDITNMKTATEALKLTQFSVDQNADAAFWMGKDAKFFYVNDTACKSLGYTREELISMSVHDIDPLFPEIKWEDHWQEIREKKQYSLESIHKAKDGREFPVELMINYLEFDGREINCAFARDISERKQNEEKLREAKEKAEQANKTKSEFISNISHEIRTPLNSIIGFSEMLTSHLQDPKLREYAASIRSAGDSLLMLINDILDLSKIEAGRLEISLEPVEIRAVITEISQIFAVKVARKNLDFVVDVQDEVPESLMLDKIRIRQVLFNLIGNAVKFTKQGYIRLIVEKIDPETADAKPGLRIRVEDSGIGIHKDAHEAIFDSFFQLGHKLGQSTEGTGLGLAITRRLVEMMGGNITLDSIPDEGSSFIITLNEVEVARDKTVRTDELDFSSEIFEGKKIMLVDDSEINRMYVKDNLIDVGVIVKEAENGAEALEWVETFKPDLILLDIMMPVMDGYEAMMKLRINKSTSAVPVLALTALAMKEDIDRIRASGFDDYLIKPFHIEELYKKIKALLEGVGDSKPKPEVLVRDETSDRIYLESIREAITRIEKHYLPLWQQANDLKEYKSIKMFADAIQAIGKELDIKLLVDYGNKLILFCDNYDIEKIDLSLADFPEYLEKMKEIAINDE